ncbi:amidohydrolase [Pseudonocardiaceae bacterium YIM PH 21723]|nr:amidohydrolase [Pseudonocardiaceae bacterium YIM PH 21723]
MTTTLLLGGHIHTPADPEATAMAVASNEIVWVGQDRVGRTLYDDADHVVQLDGAFVAPGFVDAHVHATSAGLLITGLDLTSCTSLHELLAAVRERRTTGVLWGHGWDETRWTENRPPTRAELDEAAGGTPVYLSRIDVHSALASSALIDLAPQARGEDGWSETGSLTRAAHHAVRAAAKNAMPDADRRNAQLAFLRHAAAQGVVSVHECAGPDISSAADLAEVLALGGDGTLPHTVGYWGELGNLELVRTVGARGLAGDLFIDGALGSRTAALCDPYADDLRNSGALYLDSAQIAEHLVACTRAGVQAGFHVIGDAAVAAMIDGFQLAEQQVGSVELAAARHRLEHLEMVTEDQAKQLAAWGVIASVQPQFDATWGGPDGMYVQRLGAERGVALNPLSALAAAGVGLAFGSDAPVCPVNPWAAVRAAVHHRTPGHGLSPRAAFTAHTRGGWRAAGIDDGQTGLLVPGAPAHYAIWQVESFAQANAGQSAKATRWSTDPRSRVPVLPNLEPGTALPQCLRTVRDGVIIHHREGALT